MSFSMEIPSQKEIQKVIEEEVKPVPAEVAELQQVANANVEMIMSLDLESLDKRKEILQSIEGFGMNTMRSSSEKNALLQVSVGHLSKTGDEGGQVARLDRAAHAAQGSRPQRGRFRQDRIPRQIVQSAAGLFSQIPEGRCSHRRYCNLAG